ncbi:putative nucleotide phosphoribosyltransferase [Gloeomargarita lithophora Alchichica-D10]|uniref:Putative nucleotide phosphoribosyltransferase n=1 Tax=Gloeomargarita lithophora Alchichica-D10 TaxID=1188229 RepID=A0A1J0AH67_9CYAN|nr:phosphoribosyltransferase family protein [Gloeomargarita lithophora]APB35278.1 putative nucleotide phosphoribosyltransferase [Gloeomargarita lithophora Alchichica-D10]
MPPQDYFITWEQYHHQIEQLAQTIHDSQWQFDQILAIARGGLRVGDILSRIFQKPLAILSAQSYVEKQQNTLRIATQITMTQTHLSPRLLVVDDMVDSGQTLAQIVRHLWQNNTQIQELKTAVIWVKKHTQFQPDYFVEHLLRNPWIHQPFERYDHWEF